MGKLFTLLFILLLAIASLTGYLFLTQKISRGEQQIAEGRIQLEKGKKMLAAGKAKLHGGKQRLSRAKKTYNQVNLLTVVGMATLMPIPGLIINEATKNVGKGQIAEGERLIAGGAAKIKSGERRLKAGELQLNQGVEQIVLANKIRIACGIAAIIFGLLWLVLAFCWRCSLLTIFHPAKPLGQQKK